jgi:hypothetical protein
MAPMHSKSPYSNGFRKGPEVAQEGTPRHLGHAYLGIRMWARPNPLNFHGETMRQAVGRRSPAAPRTHLAPPAASG